MQTYTHAAIGILAGVIIFPHDYFRQSVCAIGAIAPDVILVPKFIFDKLSGKQVLAKQSKRLLVAKEIVNSIPLFLMLYLGWFLLAKITAWYELLTMSFLFNYLVHLFIDAFTHGDKKYYDSDPTFLWPWKKRLAIASWEYRYDFGVLRPKPFELILLIILIISIALLTFLL
jgi:hypothetical protein